MTPEQVAFLDQIKSKYRPKEEFSIHLGASDESGKYIAAVFRKGTIKTRKGTEDYTASIANESTADKVKFEKFLLTYMEVRVIIGRVV